MGFKVKIWWRTEVKGQMTIYWSNIGKWHPWYVGFAPPSHVKKRTDGKRHGCQLASVCDFSVWPRVTHLISPRCRFFIWKMRVSPGELCGTSEHHQPSPLNKAKRQRWFHDLLIRHVLKMFSLIFALVIQGRWTKNTVSRQPLWVLLPLCLQKEEGGTDSSSYEWFWNNITWITLAFQKYIVEDR